MKNFIKKQDFLLIAVILLIAAVGFTSNWFLHQKPSATVKIIVDAEVVEELDLTKDTELIIHGAWGGTNTLIIENGTARISEASCPDKICVHQGPISQSGELMVCLPNEVIVRIDSEDSAN